MGNTSGFPRGWASTLAGIHEDIETRNVYVICVMLRRFTSVSQLMLIAVFTGMGGSRKANIVDVPREGGSLADMKLYSTVVSYPT